MVLIVDADGRSLHATVNETVERVKKFTRRHRVSGLLWRPVQRDLLMSPAVYSGSA